MEVPTVNQENGSQNGQKVLIFIDGPNLNSMQKEMGISIDFRALRDVLAAGRQLVEIRFYTQNPQTVPAKNFLKFLEGCGYIVVIAPPDEDVDDLIVGDIREMYTQADVIVLVGGDGIYVDPLTEASEASKAIEVVCLSTMLSANFGQIAEITDPSVYQDRITDRSKTARRTRQQIESLSVSTLLTPRSRFVGQLMAMGNKITIETLPGEIIIRVSLST